jgi:hypothetical protein
VATVIDVLEQEWSRLSDEMRASGEARRRIDVDRMATRNPMWTQLGHHACSLSVRGIQNLKTAQSERPRLMSKIVERVFVPRLNSPNRRLWNGRCWRILLQKAFWRSSKILRAADAFCGRRREGPYRFIENRSRTSVVALKSDAAAERYKDRLSRDFPGRSIFDFCNNIGAKRPYVRDSDTSARLLSFRVLPVAGSGSRSPTGCRHSSR